MKAAHAAAGPVERAKGKNGEEKAPVIDKPSLSSIDSILGAFFLNLPTRKRLAVKGSPAAVAANTNRRSSRRKKRVRFDGPIFGAFLDRPGLWEDIACMETEKAAACAATAAALAAGAAAAAAATEASSSEGSSSEDETIRQQVVPQQQQATVPPPTMRRSTSSCMLVAGPLHNALGSSPFSAAF